MKKILLLIFLLTVCVLFTVSCASNDAVESELDALNDEISALGDRIEALEAALDTSPSESENAAKIADLEAKLKKAESKVEFYENYTDMIQAKLDAQNITYAEISEAFGKDGVRVGSGAIIYQWELSNGDKINFYFTTGKQTPDNYNPEDILPYMIATMISVQKN